MSVEAVAKKYGVKGEDLRVEHALQLVVSAQNRAPKGGGTWQTWDWLRSQLLKAFGIDAQKDRERLDWLQEQLTRGGFDIDFTREVDETNELAIMVWRFPRHGPEVGCGHWFAGDYDVRKAIDDARTNGEKRRAEEAK